MQSIDFLRLIWGDQRGFVFLPSKGAKWQEHEAFNWPDDVEVIDHHIEKYGETNDLYYCPNLFTEPERRQEYVQNPSWLYADLDSVDPSKIELRPQVAIQSSPGRWQALWRLARRIEPSKHSEYNARLSYAVGADKGGWDLTQVLRVPGTRNRKYPGDIRVRLSWSDLSRTSLVQAAKFLKGVERHIDGGVSPDVPDLLLPSESVSSIRKRYWQVLDNRTRALLLTTETEQMVGDEGRSGVLWELECRLLEVGMNPEEVFVVVKDSIWNKYSAEKRRGADEILWREVQKAVLHVGRIITETLASHNGRVTRARPLVYTYADLLSSPIREPEWGVEDYWTLGSHGLVAGLPKSYKSLLTMDMAVSLASGTDFLGQFGTNHKAVGPVLVVQQENSRPLVRDRLLKISTSRGLQTGASTIVEHDVVVFKSPPTIPLVFYNDFGFDMTNLDDQESVETLIRQEGMKTVIFDPLYLMIGGADENKAQEMRPLLQWLLRIRNLYDCQVLVVHHWGKKTEGRAGRGMGGQRLIGSQTIYAWLEAALYMEAHHHDDGSVQVVVEREFREKPPTAPAGFNLTLGDTGKLDYSWSVTGPIGTTNKLLESINKAGPKGATLIWIRRDLDIGQKKVRQLLDDAKEKGLVEERPGDKNTRRFYLTREAEDEE